MEFNFKNFNPPLLLAVWYEQLEIVRLLLSQKGIDVNKRGILI
mgnify:CR=1 FL=1